MRKTLILVLVLAAAGLALAPEAKLTDFLNEQISVAADDELIPCYITLATQLDEATAAQLTFGLDKDQRNQAVVTWLKQTANREQADLLAYLSRAADNGTVGEYQSFWLSNFVFAELTPAEIHRIAERPEVARITRGSNGEGQWIGLGFRSEEPGEAMTVLKDGREIAWGVSKVNADDVWGEGYTGAGVSVVIGDTGQRYTHYDLHSHYDSSISYDYDDDDSDPYFQSGETHGTHCAGSVGSDGTAGTQAGCAPDFNYGAHRLYMYGNYQGELSVWASWQGAVDNNVDVVSNSLGWIDSWNPDKPTWQSNAQNAIAAGVTLVIAAGNEGPSSETLRCPGDVPEVITVGATDSSDNIAYFSSRGPSTDYGDTVIKPDVVAPGVSIKSCYTSSDSAYQGGWDGTSMATPHVAGTVALLLEADPSLTPEDIKTILEDTALELGDAGKDNTYGSGRIDALAAVQSLGPSPANLSLEDVTIVNDDNGDGKIDPGETIDIEVTVHNSGDITAENTVGTLSSTDGHITITDGDADFGNVDGGNDATDQLSFEVDASVTRPDSFDFTLTVEADNFAATGYDFTLYTPVLAIDDDVESGEGYWTHSGDQDSWHITNDKYNSPSHSWKSGSSGVGDYAGNMDAALYSPRVWFTAADATLGFWTSYELENGSDYGYVEVNDGSGWVEEHSLTGVQDYFDLVSVDLTAYAETMVRLRFRMTTDATGNGEGWFVDDIELPQISTDAGWLAIESEVGEDGVLITWQGEDAFAGFNVYREVAEADTARIKLNEQPLSGGAAGAWLDDPAAGSYRYFVEVLTTDGAVEVYGPVEVEVLPASYGLTFAAPYPNPAADHVNFTLTTAEPGAVTLNVYDIAGRRVAVVHSGELAAGRHTLVWNTAGTAAGLYIARLETAGHVLNQRVIVER
jgi:serine protease AprX